MSYSRMGKKCDIGLFSGDKYLCLGCRLNKKTLSTMLKTDEDMLLHLAAHKRHGHKVPFDVVKRVWNMIEADKEKR